MGLKEQIEKLNPYGKYKKEDVFQPGTFNPGLFEVDLGKLKKLRPEIFQPIRFVMASNLDSKSYIQMQMNDGDIQTPDRRGGFHRPSAGGLPVRGPGCSDIAVLSHCPGPGPWMGGGNQAGDLLHL